MRLLDAKWIWDKNCKHDFNQYVKFRKEFQFDGRGDVFLSITADSRYWLWINGRQVGFGPVRSYPNYYRYDKYDITPHMRTGKNAIAVLVNHFGCDTFQYMLKDPGLIACVETNGRCLAMTDGSWQAEACAEFSPRTPRISCQQAFEEQYDMRAYDGWREADYAGKMPSAEVLRDFWDTQHRNMSERGIPFLTERPVCPVRLVETEKLEEPNLALGFDYSRLIPKDGFDATPWVIDAAAVFVVEAKKAGVCPLLFREWYHGEVYCNGERSKDGQLSFREGINYIFLPESGTRHSSNIQLSVRNGCGIEVRDAYVVGPFCPRGEDGSVAFGEFAVYKVVEGELVSAYMRESVLEDAKYGRLDRIPERLLQSFTAELFPVDVFLMCYQERGTRVDSEAFVHDVNGLLGGGDYCLISPNGNDLRLLLDFGTETIGNIEFECFAEEGAVLDFHNFEFIQPDGMKNFAEGMNNTMRYVTAGGYQYFRSTVRRGLRFMYLTIRNCMKIRLKNLRIVECTYPQVNRGGFLCNDWKLNRIYEVGKNTLKNCSEDSFTDCPTYEQTLWVGDMRNEALINWVINGDGLLWYRCLEQVGQSLDYAPLTLSQVPSGWYNIMPCWTFLWMRSVCEYYTYTGDIHGIKNLMNYLKRNIDGIQKYINRDNLFEIFAWNMFDWAQMDTPCDGVVTHLNCFAILALKECAALFNLFSDTYAGLCEKLAEKISAAVNELLWDEERQAFSDCLRYEEGKPVRSKVFSQQTQTVAYMCDIGDAKRRERCRNLMANPEKDFVKAGSPFFEFFMLEAFIREDNQQAFIGDIEKSWGKMVDTGCDTFWEMWSYVAPGGRLTRSHCHGWSAAPCYFLTEYVLGVKPVSPGYRRVKIIPHPCGLAWCRGTVPTKYGDISVSWEMRDGKAVVTYTAPREVTVELD